MKIFSAFCIYNEIEMLPFKIDYMNKNNIDYYIFDNISDDGSWEWLQDNKIPSEKFDSNGMFNLSVNLKLVIDKIHEVKPDWVTMAAPDMFYVHLQKSLRQFIEYVNTLGFNGIVSAYVPFSFKFTGEESGGNDPRLTYMYYSSKGVHNIAIAKYSESLSLKHPDQFDIIGKKLYADRNFAMLHYHMRHDCKERKTTQFIRRKKWCDSQPNFKKFQAGYERLVRTNSFLFKKELLLDVTKSKFWDAIKRSVISG